MTKLNQIVALVKGEKDRVNKETAPLFHDAAKPPLFQGLTKTYRKKNEDGEDYPNESVKARYTADEVLDAFRKPTVRLLDLISTTENANTQAFADVEVDGTVLIKDAPVTFLMQLQKYLEREVRGLVVALPVLDPALDWNSADAERKGMWKTPVVTRNKTKSVQVPIELAPATDKHPAQVQLVGETIVEGHWDEIKFSGGLQGWRKQELLERVDKLIDAVKKAREAANDREIEDKHVGGAIFGYLLD